MTMNIELRPGEERAWVALASEAEGLAHQLATAQPDGMPGRSDSARLACDAHRLSRWALDHALASAGLEPSK